MEHYAVSGVRQGVTVPTTNLLLFRIPFDCTLLEVEADIGAQVPTGSAVIFDVRAGATLSTMTSIYAAPANRLTVAAGQSGAQQTPLSVPLVKGWLAVDLISYPPGGLVAPAFVAITLDDGKPSRLTIQEADGMPSVLASSIKVGNGDLQDLGGGVARLLTASDVVLPTTLPPSGSAGGDLSGFYPDPDVASVGGKVPGSASGLATLDAGGKLPTSQLPALALNTRLVVASQSAMLALTSADVQPGDFAFRTDSSEVYLLVGDDPSILSNWVIWLHPAIPTTLPPSGSAGGDLGGSYPNPSVQKLNGDALPALAVAHGFLKRNAAGTGFELVGYGTAANTVAQGNDSRLSDSRAPSGAAGGDLNGSNYPNPVVSKIAGDALPTLTVANGFFKRNSAGNGWELVQYGSAANTVTQGNDARLSDSRAPSGAAGGDLSSTYPNPVVNQLKGRSLGGIPSVSGFISDNFDDNTLDTSLWVITGTPTTNVTESSGRINITSTGGDSGLSMLNYANFTGKQAVVHVIAIPSLSGLSVCNPIQLVRDTDAWTPEISFAIDNSGNLRAQVIDGNNGVLKNTLIGAFSLTTHAYLRIRESSGVIYFDYSSTGASWTNATTWTMSFTTHYDITNMKAAFHSRHSSGQLQVDDFSTTVPATDPITSKNYFGLLWDNPNNQFSILRVLGIIPTTAGAPSGAPSNVPSGNTLLMYDMTAHIMYAWNGSTWDSQAF